MKKKILLTLSTLCLSLCITACGNALPKDYNDVPIIESTTEVVESETSTTENSTNEVDTENNYVNTEVESNAEVESNTDVEITEDVSSEANVEELLNSIDVEILSYATVEPELVYYNSDYYDSATIVTVGLTFPEGARDIFGSLKFIGDSLYWNDSDVAQHYSDSAWVNDDGTYALMLVRIGGNTDVYNIQAELKSTGGTVSVVKDVSINLGDFSNVTEAFSWDSSTHGCDSAVVEINGIHYFIVKSYESGTGAVFSDVDYFTLSREITMVQLEDFTEETSLKVCDISVDYAESENIEFTSWGYYTTYEYYNDALRFQCGIKLQAAVLDDDTLENTELLAIAREAFADATINVVDTQGNTLNLKAFN